MRKKSFAELAFLLVLGVICVQPAYAQGCAVCRTQAASETVRFIAALKEGIWVLIFPSFFVCSALAGMAYRRRDRFRGSDPEQDVW